MTVHKIMCPPNISGRVVKVYGNSGDGHDKFTLSDTVLEVENASGKIIKLGERMLRVERWLRVSLRDC